MVERIATIPVDVDAWKFAPNIYGEIVTVFSLRVAWALQVLWCKFGGRLPRVLGSWRCLDTPPFSFSLWLPPSLCPYCYCGYKKKNERGRERETPSERERSGEKQKGGVTWQCKHAHTRNNHAPTLWRNRLILHETCKRNWLKIRQFLVIWE